MKKILLLLITFAQISFILGQTTAPNFTDENGLKQGVWKENLEDNFSALINYTDNKRDGEFNAFYASSKLFIKGYFRNGVIDSLHHTFHENGVLKMSAFFVNGKENGVRKTFNKDGILKSEYNIINDKEIGFYKEYYDTGSIWVKFIPKQNNSQEGIYCVYYKSGELSLKGEMINFKKEGKWIKYKKNGTLENTYIYKNDKIVKEILSN